MGPTWLAIFTYTALSAQSNPTCIPYFDTHCVFKTLNKETPFGYLCHIKHDFDHYLTGYALKQENLQLIRIRISFLALVFTNKECAFVK